MSLYFNFSYCDGVAIGFNLLANFLLIHLSVIGWTLVSIHSSIGAIIIDMIVGWCDALQCLLRKRCECFTWKSAAVDKRSKYKTLCSDQGGGEGGILMTLRMRSTAVREYWIHCSHCTIVAYSVRKWLSWAVLTIPGRWACAGFGKSWGPIIMKDVLR